VYRSTWLSTQSIQSIIVRFIIGRSSANETATQQAAIDEETAGAGDMISLVTNVSGRVWSPLHTTFRWLQHATSCEPYRRARFIAKMDDDVYLHLPELSTHLQLLRHHRNVYYGMCYYTSWYPDTFRFSGTGYSLLDAQKASSSCIHSKASQRCRGGFPFTTGSMQLLSAEVAKLLVGSPIATSSIERSIPLAADVRRTKPAYEDAWMGYGLFDLLPENIAVTVACIDRWRYYFDADGLKLTDTSMLVHLRHAKLAVRYHMIHNFTLLHHCPSGAKIGCHDFAVPSCPRGSSNRTAECQRRRSYYLSRYNQTCFITPGNASCAHRGYKLIG
jgi:hypothetical protein